MGGTKPVSEKYGELFPREELQESVLIILLNSYTLQQNECIHFRCRNSLFVTILSDENILQKIKHGLFCLFFVLFSLHIIWMCATLIPRQLQASQLCEPLHDQWPPEPFIYQLSPHPDHPPIHEVPLGYGSSLGWESRQSGRRH